MKIVVCCDSFKGSLSAEEICNVISKTLKNRKEGTEVIELPLADGGEGTARILIKERYPIINKVKAHDPLGRLIETRFYQDTTGKKALIESSEIIGLPLLKKTERNPLKASSFGLGEVINFAISSGAEDITVTLGGSATSDCGMGMLKAYNDNWKKIKFRILCDVSNPLFGKEGAVEIFASQKGAKPSELPILEERNRRWVEELVNKGINRYEDTLREGAGAAGGLGFAFQSILKAESLKGIDFILKVTDFENIIEKADLIITGEGKIDKQSLMGKVVSGVVKMAKKKSIPVIAICGKLEDKEIIESYGLKNIYCISDPRMSESENMKDETTKLHLKNTMDKIIRKNIN